MTDETKDRYVIEDEEEEREEVYGEETEEDQEDDSDFQYRTQEEFDSALERRLKRERIKMAKELGVPLEQAKEYIEAGMTVSQAANMSPSQIKQRLLQQQQARGQQMQPQGGYYQGQPQQFTPPPANDDVRQEIKELKTMLTEKDMKDLMKQEEAKARQEFGKLYDDYAEDIREKAEDLDISPVDAAAMILRPKLKDHYENQTKKKQQFKKRRKVEGSEEGPQKGEDPNVALSDSQKRAAQKMRIPLDKYYQRLKELGEIE